jgi:Myb-like DNA-binding domain
MEGTRYNRGKWLDKEDDLLKTAYHKYESHCWRKISDMVSTRSPIQCMHRWTKILKPGLTKGKWSIEEDVVLNKYVKIYGGEKNWLEIARHLPGRSSKQCRERWTNILQPGVKKGEWTSDDDKKIFQYYLQYGARWTEIATHMVGRTENSIKNRFYSTLRRFANKDRQNGVLETSAESLCKEKLLTYVERALVEDTNFKCKRGRKPYHAYVASKPGIRKCKSLPNIIDPVEKPVLRKVKSCMQIVYKPKIKKIFSVKRVVKKIKEIDPIERQKVTDAIAAHEALLREQAMVVERRDARIDKSADGYLIPSNALIAQFQSPSMNSVKEENDKCNESDIIGDGSKTVIKPHPKLPVVIPCVERNTSMYDIIKKNNEILEHFRFVKNNIEEPLEGVRSHIQNQLEDTEKLLKNMEQKYTP